MKQYATFTKYFGEIDAADPKSIAWREQAEQGLRQALRRKLKHMGEKPDAYEFELIVYQSYEDGDMTDDTPQATMQATMQAVYFPEPIFANSLPVVLIACRATAKPTLDDISKELYNDWKTAIHGPDWDVTKS